jgi:hypothetical protein
MAGLFEGSAPPDITTTTTKQQAAPQFLTDYLTELAKFGQSQLGTTVPEVKDAQGNVIKPASFTAKTSADLIADRPDYLTNLASGIDPATGKSYASSKLPGLGALTRYQTPLDEALKAGQSAMDVSATDISKFYDLNQQQVIDEMQKQSDVNVQRNVLPALKALGVMGGAGGSGSSRTGAIGGQALADIASNLQSQQTLARSKGFQTALDAALKEQGQQSTAATALSGLGLQEQQAAKSALGMMSDLGTQQLEYEQSKIEAPLTRAANVAALMRGHQFPLSSTDTYKGPLQGAQYGPSTIDKIGSLTSFLSGIKTGSGSGKSGTLGADIVRLIKSFGGDIDLTQAELTPEQQQVISDFYAGYDPEAP